MLRLLPDVTFPLTIQQINPLLENMVQLNTLDLGVHDRMQRALAINFHVFDIWVKTKGKSDYRGPDGHSRLLQDAKTFCGATSIVTRHSELAAAHLSIDYHDTQIRLKESGATAIPSDVNSLLAMCADFAAKPAQELQQISLYLDYLGKKPNQK